MRIGLDIDDVLYPWFDAAHAACAAAGITGGVIPTSWAPYDDYGIDKELWHETIADAVDVMYQSAPFEGAVEQVTRLKEAGHTVHLVTARGALKNGHMIRAETALWAAAHEVPHDSLTFSTDKTVVRTDFFLDDNHGNWQSLWNDSDSTPYLLTKPWNSRYAVGQWRVETLEQFVNIVLNKGCHRAD
jgi:hypothetical protein